MPLRMRSSFFSCWYATFNSKRYIFFKSSFCDVLQAKIMLKMAAVFDPGIRKSKMSQTPKPNF